MSSFLSFALRFHGLVCIWNAGACICYNYFDVRYKVSGSILSLIKDKLSSLWSLPLFISNNSGFDEFWDYLRGEKMTQMFWIPSSFCVEKLP